MPRSASSKQPCRAVGGAGERALLVTEDLALEQRLGNRGAVDRDERKRRARTELMDRLRHELLARARFAGDEHRRLGRRRLLDHLIDLPHLRTVADERAERAVLAELASQRLHLAHRLQALDDLVEQDFQALDIDRLGQVVVRAFFHRLDGGVDGSLRRQQQRRHVGALLRQRAQQRESVHARHHEIGDDDGGAERRHFFERLLAVGGRLGDETPTPDQLLQADTSGRIVFDDEHALGSDFLFGFSGGFDFPDACRHHSHLNHVIFTFWPSLLTEASSTVVKKGPHELVADSLHKRYGPRRASGNRGF